MAVELLVGEDTMKEDDVLDEEVVEEDVVMEEVVLDEDVVEVVVEVKALEDDVDDEVELVLEDVFTTVEVDDAILLSVGPAMQYASPKIKLVHPLSIEGFHCRS